MTLTHDEKLITVRAMKKYGGSFVKALAECLLLADVTNQQRIEGAFIEYLMKYGPRSDAYRATEKIEA